MPPKKPAATKTPGRAPAKAATGKAAAKKPVAKGPAKGATPAGKKSAAPAAATAKAKEQKPAEKKWSAQDEAARKIQTKARQFLARKALEKKKKEKEDYEAMMDKLENEAFVKLVKMEQEQAEIQRQKEDEERRRKREELKRRKRMLEGAFDGDMDEIKQILKEVKDLDDKDGVPNDMVGTARRNKHQMNLVECEDANENTPLSEASSGGHVDAINFLVERGADPNSKGQFGRTPLYRAAFAGHLDAVQCLLQYGADPRLYAEDGQTPEQVASSPGIVETLKNWNVEETEKLLAMIDADKERRKEEDMKRKAEETSRLEDKVAEAESEYKSRQKHLAKCTQELNKRIFEHDSAMAEGFDRPQILLEAIHEAEMELEIAKIDIDKARDKLSAIKLSLRDKQLEGLSESEMDDIMPGLKVPVRELDDVLLRDVGNRIKDSGNWPLIIDTTGQASTFLRYRDTNYLNALSPQQMEANKVRLAVLGAIRYGKPLVLDMMEVDMFETVSDRFSEVLQGLMESIMDKTILQEENYLKLIKPEDPDAYNKNQFMDSRIQNFRLFIITKNPFPPASLVERCYLIRIHIVT